MKDPSEEKIEKLVKKTDRIAFEIVINIFVSMITAIIVCYAATG